jgi:hypothetical protein
MKNSVEKEVTSFIQGVKDGEIRGDFSQVTIHENIVLELSVGSFEYGHIHLRLLVEDSELQELEEEMYVQRLFAIDSSYQQVYDEIVSVIEDENESVETNAHSWEKTSLESSHPSIPDTFDPEKTVAFEDLIRVHEDLSIEEAIQTNRS